MRKRSTLSLFLLGCLWLILAGSFGYTLFQAYGHIAQIFSFGLGSLLTGLFMGRAVQQWRLQRETRQSDAVPPLNPRG
jgi:hypothetical protein